MRDTTQERELHEITTVVTADVIHKEYQPVPITSIQPEMTVVIDETIANPVLDIVIPVYNEEKDLPPCIKRLTAFLESSIPYSGRITIADNASTDSTILVGEQLCKQFPKTVRLVHLNKKGRGHALNTVWRTTDAQVAAYMDVDLSTDLNGLMPLVAPLISGHSDVAIGSRLQSGSRVLRGAKREFISRSYNLILRAAMRAKFSDAQCGFKAINTEIARAILPLVHDTGWFFDTELLILSERVGLRISEVAVDWIDDPNSKVDIVSTATGDLKGCYRVARAIAKGELPIVQLRTAIGREPFVEGVPYGMVGQIVRFAVVGVISTILNILLFLAFHGHMNLQLANFIALALSAIFNVIANRTFTFGVRGRNNAAKHYFQGVLVFFFTAVVTAGALFLLHHVIYNPTTITEIAVLIIANIIATLVRFIAFRLIFRTSKNL